MTFLFKPQRRSRNRVSARILPWASFRTVSVAYQFERTATIHCIAPGVHLNLSNGFTLLILRSKIYPHFPSSSSFAEPTQSGFTLLKLLRSITHALYFSREQLFASPAIFRRRLFSSVLPHPSKKGLDLPSHFQQICTKPNSQTVQNREPHPTLLTNPNVCAIIKKIIREQTFLADRALCGDGGKVKEC